MARKLLRVLRNTVTLAPANSDGVTVGYFVFYATQDAGRQLYIVTTRQRRGGMMSATIRTQLRNKKWLTIDKTHHPHAHADVLRLANKIADLTIGNLP